MEAMQEQPVEKRIHADGSVEGAWKAVMARYEPQSGAKMDHLKREFENIAMQGDEDRKLFFARAKGKFNGLSAYQNKIDVLHAAEPALSRANG